MFLHRVWSIHGLLVSMISHRGPQFVSNFWKALCKILRVNLKLSTSHHPETNGQTERANQEAERHLRSYLNHFQDDWVDLLPMSEFSANANWSATTKVTPLLVSRGHNQWMSFDPVDLCASLIRERSANKKAKSLAGKTEEVWDFMRAELANSQDKQAKAANRHRTDASGYKIGGHGMAVRKE